MGRIENRYINYISIESAYYMATMAFKFNFIYPNPDKFLYDYDQEVACIAQQIYAEMIGWTK